MTISYNTDELLSKDLEGRLRSVSQQQMKPKKPKAVKAINGKVKGPGTKPTQPKAAKPVNSVKPSTPVKAPTSATPSLPGYDKPMGGAPSTPAPAAPSLPGYEPNPAIKKTFTGTKSLKPKKMKPVDARTPAPMTFTVGKSYEDVEKVGLLGIGGALAGGLGRAKTGVDAMKPKAKKVLGPKRSSQVSSGIDTLKTKFNDTYRPGGTWNKKRMGTHAGLVGGGLATGYVIGKAAKTDDEKRLRDIRVGTASNVFGAGMGALATAQALKQGKTNYDDYDKQTKRGKKAGRGTANARENPRPEYRPQTKAGRAVHRHLPKGLKGNKYAIPALILGGASAGAAGQAINGAMDANSARVFLNEEKALKRKMKSEEGIVKAVEIETGNGHGTNLSSWYGSNPDALEEGFTSVGKAIRHTSEVRDTAAEKQRNKRNAVAVASAAAGTAAAGYQGAKTVGEYKQYQRSTKKYAGLQDKKGNKTKMTLRDVAGLGNAKQKIADDSASRKTLTSLYGPNKWQAHDDFRAYRDSRGRQVPAHVIENSRGGQKLRELGDKSRSQHFKEDIRPERQKKIKNSRTKSLRTARAKMSGRATLAAGGAGLAYAGYKAKTD